MDNSVKTTTIHSKMAVLFQLNDPRARDCFDVFRPNVEVPQGRTKALDVTTVKRISRCSKGGIIHIQLKINHWEFRNHSLMPLCLVMLWFHQLLDALSLSLCFESRIDVLDGFDTFFTLHYPLLLSTFSLTINPGVSSPFPCPRYRMSNSHSPLTETPTPRDYNVTLPSQITSLLRLAQAQTDPKVKPTKQR